MNPRGLGFSTVARVAVYLTLIYSTGLHLIWGPEPTVRSTYFNHPPNPRYAESFPDYGSLHDRPLETFRDDGFKLGGFATDQVEYILQSRSRTDAVSPYRERIVGPVLAGALSVQSV